MSAKQKFNKPPLEYQKQLEKLKQRGMSFQNETEAMHLLEHVNYFRFTPYWIPFQKDASKHLFHEGTCFEQIQALYQFDTKLRQLLFEAIEKIEVSIRAKWAYEISLRHGAHAHLHLKFFVSSSKYQKDLKDLYKAIDQAKDKEEFVKHYLNKYEESMPPIWVVSEVISLGLLSKLYTNLDDIGVSGFNTSAKKAIAGAYQIDFEFLESWLHVLTQVRNFSAHHARLWNREFKRTPKLVINKPSALKGQFVQGSRRLYNVLVLMLYLMDQIDSNSSFRKRLKTLLLSEHGYLPQMGFPSDWQNKTIWHFKTSTMKVNL